MKLFRFLLPIILSCMAVVPASARLCAYDSVYVLPEGKIKLEPLNAFIRDVVVPVAKSFDFDMSRSSIEVDFRPAGSLADWNISIDVTTGDDNAYFFVTPGRNQKISIWWCSGLPVIINSTPRCPLVEFTGRKTRVHRMYSPPYINLLLMNDDYASWFFEYRGGRIFFDRLSHFNNKWILNKVYWSLLPPDIRPKGPVVEPVAEISTGLSAPAPPDSALVRPLLSTVKIRKRR